MRETNKVPIENEQHTRNILVEEEVQKEKNTHYNHIQYHPIYVFKPNNHFYRLISIKILKKIFIREKL